MPRSAIQLSDDLCWLVQLLCVQVVLEFCIINDKDYNLSGTIRVLNVSYHKYVTIRHSHDGWRTKSEVRMDEEKKCVRLAINLPTLPGAQFRLRPSLVRKK